MPLFGLVDCNNFYVSCERLFNPALARQPVVVLSNNDGCVIARSQEAKALGIGMGEPLFKCRDRIKRYGIKVFSSNYALYGDLSHRVMQVLRDLEPEVDVYSIDEAFLTLPPGQELTDYAGTIRATVKQSTGIPVSIGIAPTRTLAKVANHFAKKENREQGVFNFADEPDIDARLQGVEVGDVWGIGRRYGKFLRERAIRTALDLKNADDTWVRKHLTITGLRTVMELRGIPCISSAEAPASKKSIICSRSLGRAVKTLNELQEAAATYVAVATAKLRAQGLRAANLQVFISTSLHGSRHRQLSASRTVSLPEPTAATPALTSQAVQCVARMYKPGYDYRKVGVMLTGLTAAGCFQRSLFTAPDHESLPLMEAMDTINTRWGRHTLRMAAAGLHKDWEAQQAHKSPAYTSSWDELPIVGP